MSRLKMFEDESVQLEIVNKYVSGISVYAMQKEYGVSQNAIDRILKRHGIQKRDNSHKSRKYSIDEQYFDNIDTPNKAYILGLLYSDGCNFRSQNKVSLCLQERDKSILEKINKEIGYNRPLTINKLHDKNTKWQNSYELIIVNKHISQKLEEWGVIPRKSLVLTFPTWMADDLLPHFLRGVIDGDGHIELNHHYFITVAGSKIFCEALQQYIESKYGIRGRISVTGNPQSDCRIWTITGKFNIYNLLNDIYANADLYIERKYAQFQELQTLISNCSQLM